MEDKRKATMKLYQITIDEIKQEVPGTKSFFFEIPEGLTWACGSDVHIAFPEFQTDKGPDKTWIRHMSLMTLPSEGRLGFTSRVPGSGSDFKKRLDGLKVGDGLILFKLGNRMPLRREHRPLVLISMGVGLATMRPIIHTWLGDREGIPTITNLVVDRPDGFVFREELAGIHVGGYEQEWIEGRGEFYTHIGGVVDRIKNPIYYIVGSDDFLEAAVAHLMSLGVAPEAIELDKKVPWKEALFQRYSQ